MNSGTKRRRSGRRRSVLRKFIRSPASYWRAGLATARAILERAIPELRPHMYAVAKKINTARLDKLTLIEAAH